MFTDVTLRDGLQMEAASIPTEKKLELFSLLAQCGLSRIEVTSFSHPKWMPQFADSEALCKSLYATPPAIETMAFVPNEKGLERLLTFPIPWASVFVAASETFNQKNVNASIAETLLQLKGMVDKCRQQKRKIRIYISTVFGCPYEGDLSESQLYGVLDKVIGLKPDEIALSDTIGTATPKKTKAVLAHFLKNFAANNTAMHFHNTYGLAVASALEAANSGIKLFDGSTGGIGGCPYAKGATGNVPTESLWYAFFRSGLMPALSVDKFQRVWEYLEKEIKVTVRSPLYDILKKGGKWYGVT